jgi:hypothetical protein
MPASRPGDPLVVDEGGGDDEGEEGCRRLRIPVRPELMCRSAALMSQNGIAMLTAPRTARCPIVRASRGRDVRVTATTTRRIARPTRTRNRTRLSGGSVSTPILMKR